MAKRYLKKFYGLDCIIRHDYETNGIKEKINSYRARSVRELTEFLTNIPNSDNFKSFLDVGCGDDVDIKLFKNLHTSYNYCVGIDNYLDEKDYNDSIIKGDWYEMSDKPFYNRAFDVIYINHSLEHAANIYALMQQVSIMQKKGGVLFIAVPDGNSEFGYAITSSTTHFSVLTKGFLSTTLQRFGYNVIVEEREFRPDAPELWAFAQKQYDGFGD